ncbi:MAG: outer membrane beta-barrel protein [Cytophagales bacterium]
MKSTRGFILIFLTLFLTISTQAQDVRFSLDISPSTIISRVNDEDGRPSRVSKAADGLTVSEGSEQGLNFTLTALIELKKNWEFQTGLGASDKYIYIRNTDDTYTGVSRYQISYLHLPFLLRFRSNEFNKIEKLRAFGAFGLALEIKAKEDVKGGDGAHFWNMAKQRTWADPERGRNSKNKPLALFSPLDLGLVLRGGLEYEIFDDFFVHLSLTYQHNFINMINPNLRFDTPERERVIDNLSIRTSSLLLDLGCSYKF